MRQFIVKLWPRPMLDRAQILRQNPRQEFGVYETVADKTFGLENSYSIENRLSFGDVLWHTMRELANDHGGREMSAPDVRRDGLFHSRLWTKEPPRGQMFIWAYRKSEGGWNTGLGYWTVSGSWCDAYDWNGNSHRLATDFHPMPEPPG